MRRKLHEAHTSLTKSMWRRRCTARELLPLFRINWSPIVPEFLRTWLAFLIGTARQGRAGRDRIVTDEKPPNMKRMMLLMLLHATG